MGNAVKKGATWVYRHSEYNLRHNPEDYVSALQEDAKMMAGLIDKVSNMKAEEVGDFIGQGLFEIGIEVATAGSASALTALKVADKTVDAARIIKGLENTTDLVNTLEKGDAFFDGIRTIENSKGFRQLENLEDAADVGKPFKSGEVTYEVEKLKGRRPKMPEYEVLNPDGTLTEYGKWYYDRPSGYRKGVRQKAYDAAKGSDGKVRDPLTKEVIEFDSQWDMGNKPGYEFRKHKVDAAKRGIGRKEFLNEHNNPSNYRPETRNTNRSHKLEDLSDDFNE